MESFSIVVKGGSSAQNRTGAWSGRHAVVDQSKCVKCHQCVLHCPEGCVEIEEDGKTVRVSGDHCKGCLVCAVECPARAISLSSSSSPSSLSRRKDS